MNPQVAYEIVGQTLRVLVPEILIVAASIAMMTLAPFLNWPRRRWCAISAGTLLVALVALLALASQKTDPNAAVALNDALGFYGRLVLLLSGLVLLALAHDAPSDANAGEFFGALLLVNTGAMLVMAANELVFLFVGLELVSIPTYMLLYLTRRTATTQETATKYFYLSIFSSGLLLYGLAFLYGVSGVSNLKALATLSWLPSIPHPQLGLIAVVFVLAGLCFRVAAVPFHFYAPDVYQGSPTVIAALLSWIPKGVGFVAIVRTLTAVIAVKGPDDPLCRKAIIISWIVAAATMTLGNTMGLLQNNLKRLLAYSSIAHAGYLMIGVTVAFSNRPDRSLVYLGSESIFFYLTAYALMTLGAFGVIIALRTTDREVETVDELSGLGFTQPLPALALAICLLSLSGIPPLAGFWGKLQIFSAAFFASPGEHPGPFFLLAVIGVLNAAAGAYYYLRIVVAMYLRPARQKVECRGGWPVAVAVGACASLSLLVGLYPTPVARASRAAALAAQSTPEVAPATVAHRAIAPASAAPKIWVQN
ncbi:MAG: NADH-quinone oxidoreductase subunit N [Isosphaeraceae bacterium]